MVVEMLLIGLILIRFPQKSQKIIKKRQKWKIQKTQKMAFFG